MLLLTNDDLARDVAKQAATLTAGTRGSWHDNAPKIPRLLNKQPVPEV